MVYRFSEQDIERRKRQLVDFSMHLICNYGLGERTPVIKVDDIYLLKNLPRELEDIKLAEILDFPTYRNTHPRNIRFALLYDGEGFFGIGSDGSIFSTKASRKEFFRIIEKMRQHALEYSSRERIEFEGRKLVGKLGWN